MVTRDNPYAQVGFDFHRMALAGRNFFANRLYFLQRNVGEKFDVAEHEVVGYRHDFAELLVRRFIDTDVVTEGLAHLLHAVEAFQKRHRQDDLLLLSVFPLQFAADKQVESLVCTSEFDIGFERDRVVSLHKRIQEFVHRNRQLILQTIGEIFTLENPGDRVFTGEANEAIRS